MSTRETAVDFYFFQIPSDLRNYATQVPDIGDSLCAVVDFDGSDAALKAVRELKEKFNETGMRLALLGKSILTCFRRHC